MFAFKPFGSSLFEIQIMPYSSLAPSFLSYFNPTYFISIMAHLYSLFDLYIPYGNFNFTLVLVLKFPGSLNLSFHNLSIHQFSRKDQSLAQFIPRIYNKIIIKILGYFWGVTVPVHNNEEISINYIHKGKIWNRNTTLIDDAFSFQVATDIINNDEDQEPQNIDECRRRNDWLKWKEAIQTELKSLAKREVFGPVVQTPKDIKPIGYRWVFVRKRNEQNKIVRYKARLVAQGFSQRPGIDYEETYSPVMDATTFRYLIYLAVSEGLDMRLMDVVTAYLYGSLDTNVYMKIPEGFKLPEVMNSKPQSIYSIKLQRSLYGLKQSGRMWYNRLSHYLLKEGYVNNSICPCIFIKKVATEFAIIAVYVDDLNLIGTPEELIKTVDYLKKEFEMKDLGKTKYCLGLQIEYCSNGVLIHQ